VPGGNVPGPPRAVRTTPGNGELTVRWQAPATTGGRAILGYRLLRDGKVVARIAPVERSVVDGPLTNGMAYRYRVVAVNSRGTARSGEVVGRPVGPRTGAPQINWVRSIGNGNLTAVAPAPGGGMYAGGRLARLFGTAPVPFGADRPDGRTVPGQSSGFVARFSPTGGIAWLRTIIGPSVEHVTAVEAGADGSVYATGRIEADATFSGGGRRVTVDGPALFVARYAADGDLLWARRGSPEGYGTDLAVGAGGEITVVGVRDRDPNPSYLSDDDLDVYPDVLDEDGLVVRFDAAGHRRWSLAGTSSGGGAGPTAVVALPGGRAVVAALHDGVVDWGSVTVGDPGWIGSDLLELSASGQVVRSTSSREIVTMDLARRADGSLVLGGRYRGDATVGTGPDPMELPPIADELGGGFVAVVDPQLHGRWGQGFAGGRVRTVTSAPGGDVVVAGGYRDEVTITGTDRSVELEALLGAPGDSWDHDVYLARFRGDGRVRWATDAGGGGRDTPTQVRVATTGHLLLSGTCGGGWARFGEPGHQRDVGRTGPRQCHGAPPPFVESWVARFGGGAGS
jgi:hypothetical protein